MDLAAGTVLQSGKYLIRQIADQSKFGITFIGDRSMSHQVVLKSLKPELQTQPNYVQIKQRFNQQVSRFSQCRHPALVQLIDTFEEQNLPFAVTDYTQGQTLAEWVRSNGVLPEDTAIRFIQQVGAALEVLHQHGLIHRNVTPDHIIHPPGSDIVVLVNVEFLVADLLEGVSGEKIPRAGEYAAIERYQPQPILTPATDVYSLAGTLYFLLTGHAPISAPLRSQTALVAPRQFRPQLNPAIETAILKGLEMHPKARPISIAAWLNQIPPAASPSSVSLPSTVKDYSAGATAPGQAQKPTPDRSTRSPTIATKQQIPLSKSNTFQQSMISLPSKRFSSALVTTAAVAAAIGVGSGLALRLAATTTGPGASFFHSEQSFPDLNGWPGEITPIEQPAYTSPPPSAAIKPERYEWERPKVVPTAPPAQEAVIPSPEAVPASPAPELPPAAIEPVAPPPVTTPNEPAPESFAPAPPVPEPAPPLAPVPAAPPPPAAN
ncbi:MAG: protein kinase [Leptolyngbyaceae cyanobacterium bins.302]|nr:protein kinase [Leptolyngbyaceae cyanobacterium bins.302]